MRKIVLISFFLCSFLALPPHPCVHASGIDQDQDAVLTAAENLFKAMQKKDYARIWTLLSIKSRGIIAGDTCKAMKCDPGREASVSDDFARGGPLAKAYWDAYLKHFDPVIALEESRWEMGPIKGDRAEIMISHKKAQKPATLYMNREGGMWRVGLTESFWARK